MKQVDQVSVQLSIIYSNFINRSMQYCNKALKGLHIKAKSTYIAMLVKDMKILSNIPQGQNTPCHCQGQLVCILQTTAQPLAANHN